MQEIKLTQMEGFFIGHAQNEEAGTGVTVLYMEKSTPAGVSIRGGGPASRETPLLSPLASATGIHAVVLSGGSAFGLGTAEGVMQYLEEQKIGFDVGVTKVPLVCTSCLFDLAVGDSTVRPDAQMAYQACQHASRTAELEGNIGAGTGCTVGKVRGIQYAMKAGLGSFAVQVGNVQVGALVAVNALGDVFDIDTGKQLAGMLDKHKMQFASSEQALYAQIEQHQNPFQNTNTTLGVVLTNAKMDKCAMNKVAEMAQNGLARTIRPVHTGADGDTVYALSLGQIEADSNAVGTLASYVLGKAVNRAVWAAQSAYGLPSARDFA